MDAHLFVPLYYTGVDYVARWSHINRPATQSLYGPVMETWWRDKDRGLHNDVNLVF